VGKIRLRHHRPGCTPAVGWSGSGVAAVVVLIIIIVMVVVSIIIVIVIVSVGVGIGVVSSRTYQKVVLENSGEDGGGCGGGSEPLFVARIAVYAPHPHPPTEGERECYLQMGPWQGDLAPGSTKRCPAPVGVGVTSVKPL
jgi:hypothetical protein